MKPTILIAGALVLAVVLLLSPLAAAAPAAGSYPIGMSPFDGVLTISSSCALSSASAPVSQSGSTFTLTGPLDGSLVVACPGAVIDGAGHLLNYSQHGSANPGVAVTVNGTRGVTVENLEFANQTDGIAANDSSDLTVTNDTISDTPDTAVSIQNSTDVSVTENHLNDSGLDAVLLFNVSDATVRGNDGNASDRGFDAVDSQNVTFDGNNASFSFGGIYFGSTENGNASGNAEFADFYAMDSMQSINLSFYHNGANDSAYGLYAQYDQDLSGTDNWMLATGQAADIFSCTYVTLRDNAADGTQNGFEFFGGSNFVVSGNNASDSSVGFFLEATSSSVFEDNVADRSLQAFALLGPTDSLIQDNTARFSEYAVRSSYDDDTTFLGNDFANSTNTSVWSSQDSTDASFVDNDLSNASQCGVCAQAPIGQITFTGNDIAHAGGEGIELMDSYASVTATGNNLSDPRNFSFGIDESYGSIAVTDNDVTGSGTFGIALEETAGAATIVGNNASGAHEDGIALLETFGPVSVDGNVAEHAGGGGILAEETMAPVTISQNDVSRAAECGICAIETAVANITSNDVNDSLEGISVLGSVAATLVADNYLLNASDYGIYAVGGSESNGPVDVEDNVASSPHGVTLFYQAVNWSDQLIEGNNFSASHELFINDSEQLSVIGNDFLGDAKIDVTNASLNAFYHNDLNTSAFNGNLTVTADDGPWSAPYPVGGNYWAGYTGADQFSGPSQNVPGSDGIGDAPEPVPRAGPGVIDQYPLTHPWASDPSMLRFDPSGLPSTALWSVTVTFHGYGSGTSTDYGAGDAPVDVAVPFGAATPYSYVLGHVAGYVASPALGTGTTAPGTSTTSIAFAPFSFNTTFTARGISAGTGWNLTLNGQTYPTTALAQIIALPNGTYAWTATTPGVPSVTGTAVVDGANAAFVVAFPSPSTPLPPGTFAVVFTESGVSTGASWTVTFAGSTETSSGTTILFAVENGTYAYTVTTTGSAAPQHPSGSVTVTGAATGELVLFGSATGLGSSSSSSGPTWPELYAAIGLAALFVLLAILGFTQSSWRGGPGRGNRPEDASPGSPPPGPAGAYGGQSPPPSGSPGGPGGPSPPPPGGPPFPPPTGGA